MTLFCLSIHNIDINIAYNVVGLEYIVTHLKVIVYTIVVVFKATKYINSRINYLLITTIVIFPIAPFVVRVF